MILKKNEAERISALQSYGILDTSSEQIYESIIKLASDVCETPISFVSLVDKNRQWFKSKKGLDIEQTPRNIAFCNHTIESMEPLIVEDALNDHRFFQNPLVVSSPFLRFYAGIPIVNNDGFAIGTICVADKKPKKLNVEKIEILKNLASHVMSQFEVRKLKQEINRLELTIQDLRKFTQKQRISYSVMHEIKNPLTIIYGKLYLLKKKLDQEDLTKEKLLPDIDSTFHAAVRIQDIMKEIKNSITNPENKKFESCSLFDFLKNAVDQVKDNCISGNIDFKLSLTLNDISFDCNPVQLTQVIVNLVSNSIDEISILAKRWIEIQVTTIEDDTKLKFVVIDSGSGIAKNILDNLMEPFTTTKIERGGTGLGLNISKKIVADHNGILYLDQNSINTKFVFEIPIRQVDKNF